MSQQTSCSCCLGVTCSCPLRFNELAPTTARPLNLRSRKRIANIMSPNHQLEQHLTNGLDINGISNRRSSKPIDTNTTRHNNYDTVTTLEFHHYRRQPRATKSITCKPRIHNSPQDHQRAASFAYTNLLLVGFCLLTLSRFANSQQSSSSQVSPFAGSSNFALGPSLCPLVPSCHCKWSNGKQGASCERKNLAQIPSQLPSDTQVLDLTGNNLQQLQAHIFQDKHLTNLQKLFLSDCKISYIADEAFAQLTNLVELDLSHNNLQYAPISAMLPMQNSLRRLVLAHNPIQTIEPDTFSPITNLNTLDLSNCQLSQLKANSFLGLSHLKELKLNENRLTSMPLNVTQDLNEYLYVDLYGNPWHCDCELRQSIDLMLKHKIQQSIIPTCNSPAKHKDIRWHNIKAEEFMCPPQVLFRQHEIVVGAGSNISLPCSARGSAPLTFVWFQDERNLTTPRSNASEPPPSTKLLEEKRYEIAEELGPPNVTTSILYLMNLKITDTSLFLCWVENGAGYTIANYSLIVNDSPPAHLIGNLMNADGSIVSTTGGATGQWSIWQSLGLYRGETQAGLLGLLFLFVLLAAIVILILMLKQNYLASRSSKNSHLADIKYQKSTTIESLAAARKFSQSQKQPNNNYDEDDENHSDDTDTENSNTDSSSGSSCRKTKPSILAARDLDGFIEHMRSGIINMDYHTMSPVIQFNNNSRSLRRNQQPQVMTMSHFPSASNTSSQVPYYGANGGGSNSMATTMSDLSPSSASGSTNINFCSQPINNIQLRAQHQVQPTNCDQLQGHNQMDFAGNTNTTTTSYTSDYQSGYGEQEHANMMTMPPVYFEGQQQLNGDFYNHQQQQQHQQQMRPNSMLLLQQHHQPQDLVRHQILDARGNPVASVQGSAFQIL